MADKKKVGKKVAKKVAKKTTAKKPVAKKAVAKKPVKKVTKKVAKKVTSKKTVTKKAAKKTTKKATKSSAQAKKATAANKNNIENRIDQLQSAFKENLKGLNTDKAEELAKNVWLAGLGAYSRTFNEIAERRDDIQDRVDAINSEGQKVFEDLVVRGQELQEDAEKVLEQGRETLEGRVEEFKQRFGGGLSSFVDIPGRLREAAEKIEEISDKLQKKK